jgi:hypothetical protein
VDGVLDAAQIGGAGGVAGLMRGPEDRKPGSALRRHFRHERHTVEAALAVERRQDFGQGAHLDPFADTHCARNGHVRSSVLSSADPVQFRIR